MRHERPWLIVVWDRHAIKRTTWGGGVVPKTTNKPQGVQIYDLLGQPPDRYHYKYEWLVILLTAPTEMVCFQKSHGYLILRCLFAVFVCIVRSTESKITPYKRIGIVLHRLSSGSFHNSFTHSHSITIRIRYNKPFQPIDIVSSFLNKK